MDWLLVKYYNKIILYRTTTNASFLASGYAAVYLTSYISCKQVSNVNEFNLNSYVPTLT